MNRYRSLSGVGRLLFMADAQNHQTHLSCQCPRRQRCKGRFHSYFAASTARSRLRCCEERGLTYHYRRADQKFLDRQEDGSSSRKISRYRSVQHQSPARRRSGLHASSGRALADSSYSANLRPTCGPPSMVSLAAGLAQPSHLHARPAAPRSAHTYGSRARTPPTRHVAATVIRCHTIFKGSYEAAVNHDRC